MTGLIDKICTYNKAMAEPTRLKILKLLWSHAAKPLTVSQVAETLGLSQPAATKHLQLLLQSGLLTRSREGPAVFYQVSADGFKEYKRTVDIVMMVLNRPCINNFRCDNCPHKDNCC